MQYKWFGILAALAIAGVGASSCCEGAGDIVDIAGGGFKFFQDISSAPGTAELTAEGCQQAFVITPEALDKFLTTMEKVSDKHKKGEDENAEKKKRPELEYRMVVCNVQAKAKAPKCEALSKAYVGAVSDLDSDFGLVVNVQSSKEAVCDGLYSSDGTRKSDLPRKSDGNVDMDWMPEQN